MSDIDKTKEAIRAAIPGRYVFVPNLPHSALLCNVDELVELASSHDEQAAEIERLTVLLKMAKCPVCDGSGCYPVEDGYEYIGRRHSANGATREPH